MKQRNSMIAPPWKPIATPTSKAILRGEHAPRPAHAPASTLQAATSPAPALPAAAPPAPALQAAASSGPVLQAITQPARPKQADASPGSARPARPSGISRLRGVAALLLLAALSFWPGQACSPPPGHAPVARLTIEPAYVPANEATEVLLDGRRSCDQFDAPDGCVAADETPPLDCPNGLRYHWTVSRDLALLDGGPDQPWMRVSVTTDVPVSVTLTVTDCDGRTASITRQIGVILTWPDQQD